MTALPPQAPARLRIASVDDAPLVHRLIHQAFEARPDLTPPADALGDTVEDIAARLTRGDVAVIASIDGEDAGCLIVHTDGDSAELTRVGVLPQMRRRHIASLLVEAGCDVALSRGATQVRVAARKELTKNIALWQERGFVRTGEDDHLVYLSLPLPVRIDVPTAEDMHALGMRLAQILVPGDVIIATGELGSGKTTLTQGLGEGLQVEGTITSPTFVLSHIHPNQTGIPLVHVDAYRLGSASELDDIDLDETLAESVTLIEWGEGLAEHLADDRLEIVIRRSDDPADQTRSVDLWGVGSRWDGDQLEALASQFAAEMKDESHE